MWEIFDCDDNDGRVGLGAIRGGESTHLMITHVLMIYSVPFDSKPQDLVYAPDGSALAITCYDGYVVSHVSAIIYPNDGFTAPLGCTPGISLRI